MRDRRMTSPSDRADRAERGDPGPPSHESRTADSSGVSWAEIHEMVRRGELVRRDGRAIRAKEPGHAEHAGHALRDTGRYARRGDEADTGVASAAASGSDAHADPDGAWQARGHGVPESPAAHEARSSALLREFLQRAERRERRRERDARRRWRDQVALMHRLLDLLGPNAVPGPADAMPVSGRRPLIDTDTADSTPGHASPATASAGSGGERPRRIYGRGEPIPDGLDDDPMELPDLSDLPDL